MNILMSYRWPGNIRELEKSYERAVVVAERCHNERRSAC